MPKMSQFRRISAAAALLVITACTGLGDLKTPTLEVVGIQMMSTDMFAQRFTVRMHVQNPNDVELPVRGIDYKLFLMGDHGQDSADSRAFGPVPVSQVIGRAWLRYWPFDHFGVLATPTYAAPSDSQTAP